MSAAPGASTTVSSADNQQTGGRGGRAVYAVTVPQTEKLTLVPAVTLAEVIWPFASSVAARQ